ncbi:hypothetical protein [Thiomicrorhabdus aquaedulcis]|uniref:hypothetical protein n=1 Tax=Thiomicrorhabdus aquaedulcis TaxID=2211106 RepID=UPI000FDA5BAA|nr:hypothetical protein [Thiomicrorhabdus aquaedulcis]
MKKLALASVLGLAGLSSFAVQASGAQGVGVAVNYGLISGPALEVSYPISDVLQVRGALSAGMGLSESTSDTDINYDVEADGGIHRLSMDYHPFAGSFFLSAGYAFNDFKLKANGRGTGSVDVGDETYDNADLNLKGQIEWDSAPMLSLGFGHSPEAGWGAMIEVGAIFTGSPDASLDGTGTYDNGTVDVSTDPSFQQALRDEEAKLQNDVGDFDFLPILQAGVTYRF